jgi:hypothetical protein
MTTDMLYTDFRGLIVGVCLSFYKFIKFKANRMLKVLQCFIHLRQKSLFTSNGLQGCMAG